MAEPPLSLSCARVTAASKRCWLNCCVSHSCLGRAAGGRRSAVRDSVTGACGRSDGGGGGFEGERKEVRGGGGEERCGSLEGENREKLGERGKKKEKKTEMA